MVHEGSCHCGRIAFTVEGSIDSVLDCNCSLCRRRGGLLWFAPAGAFTLTTPIEDVHTYEFNQHRLHHHFCAHCGIAPYTNGTDRTGNPTVAINVRCLPAVDLATLKVTQWDGASH